MVPRGHGLLLIAGRSPFEIIGGDNGTVALVGRIEKAKVPPTGRPDVPRSLEALLARAMSKRPADRQAGALEFIRDLQAVEEELALPQTQLEVAMDDWALATAVDPDERTRIGAGTTVGSSRSRRRRARSAARPRTVDGNSQGSGAERGRAAPPSTGRLIGGVAVAAAVFVGLVVAGLVTLARDAGGIPVVTDVRARTDGAAIEFAWEDPGLRAGDAYIVTVDGAASPPQRAAAYSLSVDEPGTVCVSVTVWRDGKSGTPSVERCTDVDEVPG
ncbi:hypothetical protein GCM10025870_06760 [Agromyces marinus]|uniref:Fibronectin type-III domain-containing protein n=1 Tax=Agromyces marinus TaxID=1389020 RepID=A0ABM8GYN7_9MICO|nr:hypothetical protein GCM10025870_06760 [Agromyces marinus]